MSQDVAQEIVNLLPSGRVAEVHSNGHEYKGEDFDSTHGFLVFSRRRIIQWNRKKEYKLIETIECMEFDHSERECVHIATFSDLRCALTALLSFGSGMYDHRYCTYHNISPHPCTMMQLYIDSKIICGFDLKCDTALDLFEVAESLIL